MINLFLKKNSGAATLIITVMLLVMSTMIVIFAANQGRLLSNITSNQLQSRQAYQAAQAGLEFGINYLQQNSAAILASPVGGYLAPYSNSSTTNVSLSNGSKFSITYSNPTANNYNLIQISSLGTSADGTSTKTVKQLVQFGSVLSAPPTVPLVSQGGLSMSGNSTIKNVSNNTTVELGGAVSITGNGNTQLSSGQSSTAGNIKSDVQQNVNSISSMTQSDFFATYFGTSATTVQNNIAHTYTNNSSTNYSSTLNGMTGTSVWINQTGGTASISGTTTIGSAASPVLLIVDGSLNISGNVTIYGFVFIIGPATATTDISGNVGITGGLVTTDNFNMSGNTVLTYNSSVLSALQKTSSMSYYAKVPGTWSDF